MATSSPRYVLLSGGAGYVGSHTLIQLLESSSEYKPVVVDNLYNASRESITRIEKLTGREVSERGRVVIPFACNYYNAVV